MNPAPSLLDLSVIIASQGSEKSLRDCIDSILACGDHELEIISVGNCRRFDEHRKGESSNRFSFIPLPARTPLPTLLGAGIAASNGRIVTITDSTCIVDSAWVDSILEAHSGRPRIVGGAVEPGEISSNTDWTAYLKDYGEFMQPLVAMNGSTVAGNNFSTIRSVLEIDSPFLGTEFWKTQWCEHMRTKEIDIDFASSVVTKCTKHYSLHSLIQKRFHDGWLYSSMRAAESNLYNRIVFAMRTPLIPFLFLLRTFRFVLWKRRFFGRFTKAIPLLLLTDSSWALGELAGSLVGTSINRKKS